MTTNKPEAVKWGNDPRKITEADLLPCPNCRHRAGRATERATKGFPFTGLWKVSCQRPDCPLAMIYFHPVEWNCLPRVSQAAHEALQAECDALAKALEWYSEQVLGCRKTTSEGEQYRTALDRDGGARARAALAAHRKGGE